MRLCRRSLQVGTFEAEVSAPGYITMRKLVATWDATNGAGCMWFVLSPLLQKDQYVGAASAALRCAVVSAECGMSCARRFRTVLTWTNTAKPLSSLSTVVTCSATAFSPACQTEAVINGVSYVSHSLHNVEIPSLGEVCPAMSPGVPTLRQRFFCTLAVVVVHVSVASAVCCSANSG